MSWTCQAAIDQDAGNRFRGGRWQLSFTLADDQGATVDFLEALHQPFPAASLKPFPLDHVSCRHPYR